jgi:hypothetical protein
MVQVYHWPGPCASWQTVTLPLAKGRWACHTNSMKNENEMQVYAVMGGFNYEGECGYSLQLFDCKSAADAYAKELEEGDFDYAEIKTLNVQMQSAIAA